MFKFLPKQTAGTFIFKGQNYFEARKIKDFYGIFLSIAKRFGIYLKLINILYLEVENC